ncbi:hypothetical protein CWI75_16605 [Kineobactrum sediminis]|uniref:Uncharacterized protein n=1 Tax=Kineobactrum sediminis TaxID=1905677 RepID=A0A2N5XYR2_9GAMM|nr:VIT1/CCC1 transporter family protein [Kineobactrum sediminis]PLW81249.1 hypothetical protein CWI75_16605 [Kineobactrum sediminis]
MTTFAIVAGVTGASLSSTVVLILGFASLLADGFSMATSDYRVHPIVNWVEPIFIAPGVALRPEQLAQGAPTVHVHGSPYCG